MIARIALVTAVDLPAPPAEEALRSPDLPDEVLLLPLLPEAELVAWDNPNVDWASYDAVIVRSTWNYHDRLDAFLEWATRVSRVSTLHNSLETIEWNTDKRYLADLAQRGYSVVPTTFVDPGHPVPDDVVVPLDGHLVVKPSVGADAKGAMAFDGDERAVRAHIGALHDAGKTAMIQAYLAEIDAVGETALIYLAGVFSHAARKAALLVPGVAHKSGSLTPMSVSATRPSAAERELGDAIVASLPPLAYARVDLLPTSDGPTVLELELTEPSLFLALSEGATERAAAAFRALLG